MIRAWRKMRADAVARRTQELMDEERKQADVESITHLPAPMALKRLEARIERLEKALELRNTLTQRKLQCSCGCHNEK